MHRLSLIVLVSTAAAAQVPCQVPGPCDDGNVCTANDTCNGNFCLGTKISCNDNDVCTDDLCNPQTGCFHTFNAAPCDDGNGCTASDTCNAGICAGGTPTICPDDNNPCTTASCTPALGCVQNFNTAPCNDGNSCTLADTCSLGLCQGMPKHCDDGNDCTSDLCNQDLNGACQSFPLDAGACSDGDLCSQNDHCFAGGCVGGGPVTCADDGNPCTSEFCASDAGCGRVLNTAACDDSDFCTLGDHCSSGLCVPGTPRTCSDGNTCTSDVCSPDAGACLHLGGPLETSPCDDANACTVGDQCASGLCQPGTPRVCNDGNACTDDACLPSTGACTASNDDTNLCSDANACTTADHCSSGTCVSGGSLTCADDGNPCTSEFCAADAGCGRSFNTSPCDDSNFCTVSDRCSGGVCVPGALRDCEDGNVCTRQFCNVDAGVGDGGFGFCSYAGPNPFTGERWPCDDANACTLDDVCDPTGACRPGTPRVCNDGNACTDDTCVPSTGACAASNDDTNPCSDENACTTADRCSSGTCVSGGPLACADDGNPCTSEFCVADAGCGRSFNTSPCEDSNTCTVGDRCSGGVCVPGPLRDCEDGNQCTRQFCNVDAGLADGGFGICSYSGPDPFSGERWPCDDGNACTLDDVCDIGSACRGTARSCDDGNACTLDACEPTTGVCVRVPEPSCGDGGIDAGASDAGPSDAGSSDGGPEHDAGVPDAGTDAGTSGDAGTRDAGMGPGDMGGCGCRSVDPLALIGPLLLALRLRRSRRR